MNFLAITSNAYELHFAVGFMISLLFRKKWLLVCILAAYGKEIHDYFFGGTVDFWDFAWTIYGGYFKIASDFFIKKSLIK